jgi:hypothetical protein
MYVLISRSADVCKTRNLCCGDATSFYQKKWRNYSAGFGAVLWEKGNCFGKE